GIILTEAGARVLADGPRGNHQATSDTLVTFHDQAPGLREDGSAAGACGWSLRRPRWQNSTFLMSSRSVLGRAGRLSGWNEPASNTPWPWSSTLRPAARCGPTGPRGRSPR